VQHPFEFDLLARKAADALGVSEELLRGQARGPQHGAPARGGYNERTRGTRAAARTAQAAGMGDGAAAAEIGLLAVALLHPPLRAEIVAHAETFEDPGLAATLAEVCASDEPPAALQVSVIERLGEAQGGRLSALAVGPLLETVNQARALASDYADALMRRARRRTLDATRRAAHSAASADEAAAAAQELIALRRRDG